MKSILDFKRCGTCWHAVPNGGCGRFCTKHGQNVSASDNACDEHELLPRYNPQLIRLLTSPTVNQKAGAKSVARTP